MSPKVTFLRGPRVRIPFPPAARRVRTCSISPAGATAGCRTGDAASGSVAGSLRHRSRSGGRPVERAVHLLEGAALGFGTECQEVDHTENVPGGEVDEGRAEHDEVWHRRLDDVAGSHDQRQTPPAP